MRRAEVHGAVVHRPDDGADLADLAGDAGAVFDDVAVEAAGGVVVDGLGEDGGVADDEAGGAGADVFGEEALKLASAQGRIGCDVGLLPTCGCWRGIPGRRVRGI